MDEIGCEIPKMKLCYGDEVPRSAKAANFDNQLMFGTISY